MAVSLQFERLEDRIALTVAVSGEVFWDANRNGFNDDPAVSHESVTVIVRQHQFDGSPATIEIASGVSQVGYTLSDVDDETFDGETNFGFEVADIEVFLHEDFVLTSPLASIRESSISVTAVTSEGGYAKTSWMETADLDGINGPDLIFANFNKKFFTVLLNDGNGGFANRFEISTPVFASSLATGDFDGDGDIDVAVASRNSDFLRIYENDGSGNFAQPDASTTLDAGGGNPSTVIAIDVDNDGDTDLVSTNFWQYRLSVYENQSTSGNFSFTVSSMPIEDGSFSAAAVHLDDSSGLPSLVILDTVQDVLRIYRNNGTGGFAFSGETIPARGSVFVTAGRIDGDNYDDLALYSEESQQVLIQFADETSPGVAGYDPQSSIEPFTEWFPRGIALADVDSDGDIDLVANQIDGFGLSILRNDGERQISSDVPKVQVPFDAFIASPPALADFDRDGTIDIAYSPDWENESIVVEFQKVTGGRHVVSTTVEGGLISGKDFGVARVVSPASTAAGDYDGDNNVNALDLEVWKANFGRTAGPGMSADSNGSNRVDGADFLNWQRNFGNVVAPVQALAETATATASTQESFEEAVALDANMVWLPSSNFAFSSAGPLRTSLTQTQLKDVVFTAEAVSDSQLRALRNDWNEIRVPSQSQETLPRRAAFQSPTDTLFSDLDQRGFFEGFDFETE